MNQIQCHIRKEWVAAQPEEQVRQQLIAQMVQLGYPVGYIAVEKELSQMPHLALKCQTIPDRRLDVVCFAKGIHPDHALYPLLIIECKAVPLTAKVLNQVVGYNHFVRAFFVAVANQNEIKVGCYDAAKKSYQFANYLPAYTDLLKAITQ